MAKTKNRSMYLLRENGREEWLDNSDASPSCNRAGAQRAANAKQRPVIMRTKGDGRFLYRVEPEEPNEAAG